MELHTAPPKRTGPDDNAGRGAVRSGSHSIERSRQVPDSVPLSLAAGAQPKELGDKVAPATTANAAATISSALGALAPSPLSPILLSGAARPADHPRANHDAVVPPDSVDSLEGERPPILNSRPLDRPTPNDMDDGVVYVASITDGRNGSKRRLTVDSKDGMFSLAAPPRARRTGAPPGLSTLAAWQSLCIGWGRPELAGLSRLSSYADVPPLVALFHLDLCGSLALLRSHDQYGASMSLTEHRAMVAASPDLLALVESIRRPPNLQHAAAFAIAAHSSDQARGLMGRPDLLCPLMQRLVAAALVLRRGPPSDLSGVALAFDIDLAEGEAADGARCSRRLGLALALCLAQLSRTMCA